MMVLGPKHVRAVLVFQCVKIYICILRMGLLSQMHLVGMTALV